MKRIVVIQVYKIDNDFFFLQKFQYLSQKVVIVGCFRCFELFGMWEDACYKCFIFIIVVILEWFNYSCFVREVYEEMIFGSIL